jgi:hypothetical protein
MQQDIPILLIGEEILYAFWYGKLVAEAISKNDPSLTINFGENIMATILESDVEIEKQILRLHLE